MKQIIKNRKDYICNKFRIWYFHYRFTKVMNYVMYGGPSQEEPWELRYMSWPEYRKAYEKLSKLIKENKIRILNGSGLFRTTAPVGPKLLFSPNCIEFHSAAPEYNMKGHFYFCLQDILHENFIEDDSQDSLKSLYNYFDNLYYNLEQDAIRREQERLDRLRNPQKYIKPEKKPKSNMKCVEGACQCCGTQYSLELNGFAPSCPNCGAPISFSLKEELFV